MRKQTGWEFRGEDLVPLAQALKVNTTVTELYIIRDHNGSESNDERQNFKHFCLSFISSKQKQRMEKYLDKHSVKH